MQVRIDIISLYVGNEIAATLRASLLDASGATVASVDATGASAELDNINPGSYTAQAQCLDGTGAPMGNALTYEFAAVDDGVDRTFYGSEINVAVLH